MSRPRLFSVASVIWLYLAPGWILVGGFGLYLYFWLGDVNERINQVPHMSSTEREIPLVFLWFPAGVLLLGIAGLVGALGLLRCKESGRRTVQLASYGASLLLAAFTVNWMLAVTEGGRYSGPSWEQIQMALMGLVCGLLLVVPFFVLARKLGNRELRFQTK